MRFAWTAFENIIMAREKISIIGKAAKTGSKLQGPNAWIFLTF